MLLENMAQPGIKAGNELVREILEMKLVSKYRMAKDLNVADTTIYNWLKGVSSPDIRNYVKLKDYRLHMDKVKNFKPFGI